MTDDNIETVDASNFYRTHDCAVCGAVVKHPLVLRSNPWHCDTPMQARGLKIRSGKNSSK